MLEAYKKEKNEALSQAQEYVDQLLNARQAQKDAKTHGENVEDRNMSEIEPTLVCFYENVIKFEKLRWLDEGYPRALAMDWEEIVKQEKEHLDGLEVDEDKLKDSLSQDFDLDACIICKIMLDVEAPPSTGVPIGILPGYSSKDLGESSTLISQGLPVINPIITTATSNVITSFNQRLLLLGLLFLPLVFLRSNYHGDFQNLIQP